MRLLLAAVLAALAAPSASAASAPPTLRPAPDLAKDAQAYPTLIGASKAIARINRVLRAANAQRRKDIDECRRAARPRDYVWEQSVDAPLLGAHFVSFWAHGNSSCGGAHPNLVMEALVFDLATGERVDWRKLLPASLGGAPRSASGATAPPPDAIASPALTALFVAESEKEGADADCSKAFAEQEMNFELWPDAKAKGLAMRAANLLHWAEGVCSGPVTIPGETLKRLGVDALLIQDIETGRHQVAEP